MTETPRNKPAQPNVDPEALFTGDEWSSLASWLGISERERQVLQGVCDNLKDGAIAERMAISVPTVRTHFERLFRKLGVNSRSGLVVCLFKTYLHRSRTQSAGSVPNDAVSSVSPTDKGTASGAAAKGVQPMVLPPTQARRPFPPA